MKNWQILIDQMIRESIGDGDVSHLPGAGKPLKLDDDPFTPADMQVSFKIMKDNDVTPDWMMAGKFLNEAEEKLRTQLEHRATRYQQQQKEAFRKGAVLEEIQIENSWKLYITEFSDRVEHHNKKVLLYNISVPKQIPHKPILVSEKLIATALQQTKGDI